MNTRISQRILYPLACVIGFLFFLAVQRTSAQNSPRNDSSKQDPGAASGLRLPENGTEQIRVIGHLPLENMHVNQMFVQQHGSKTYLFLHRPGWQAYAIVDVSNPQEPKVVTREALKGSDSEHVQPPATGSAFAIATMPEDNSGSDTASALPTETIQFFDMSDPKNPKAVKSFKGVTAVYPDDSRKLVYVANTEGLWIITHHMTHPLPLCNSESALTPEPDCQ